MQERIRRERLTELSGIKNLGKLKATEIKKYIRQFNIAPCSSVRKSDLLQTLRDLMKGDSNRKEEQTTDRQSRTRPLSPTSTSSQSRPPADRQQTELLQLTRRLFGKPNILSNRTRDDDPETNRLNEITNLATSRVDQVSIQLHRKKLYLNNIKFNVTLVHCITIVLYFLPYS